MNAFMKGLLGIRKFIVGNLPSVLTGLSLAGGVTTVILAIQATPKAIILLDEAANKIIEEHPDEKFDGFTRTEVVKIAWKPFVPVVIMGVISGLCGVGANSVNIKRNAALAGLYSLTEATLREYQSKVVETFGDVKAQKVKDDINHDRIIRHPPKDNEVTVTGHGNVLCYDKISGRYFRNDIENIRKIQNDKNRDLMDEMTVSLNEMYDALGLPHIKIGDELGWIVEDGLLDFQFSSQLTENGEPCLVVDYTVDPIYSFRNRC